VKPVPFHGKEGVVRSSPTEGSEKPCKCASRTLTEGRHKLLVEIRDREVGVATEMLLTKAEQVSDDEACAAGVRLLGHDA
jgi:hypothetical protein